MLGNAFEILTAAQYRKQEAGQTDADYSLSFSGYLATSCGRIREAWTTAVFSASGDGTLRRYFDFHFKLLSSLISQNNTEACTLEYLNGLMDDLLLFYGNFIGQQQFIAPEYFNYRLQKVRAGYQLFMTRLNRAEINDNLRDCLYHCLRPLYTEIPGGTGTLGDIFYREKLICELNHLGSNTSGIKEKSLINTLMALNFNHFLFFQYLQDEAKMKLEKIEAGLRAEHLLNQSISIPLAQPDNSLCFDRRWMGISDLYKTWLYEQGTLLSPGSISKEVCPKIPLNISVAYLACMIRGLYDSGLYGNVTLTAIFEHAAKVFTTKRQEHISAESLSNAYYNISQQTAARMIAIFNKASDSIKLRYFPA